MPIVVAGDTVFVSTLAGIAEGIDFATGGARGWCGFEGAPTAIPYPADWT